MDFGVAIVSCTARRRRPAALFKCDDGTTLEFMFADENQDGRVCYYKCVRCMAMRKRDRSLGPVPRVKIVAGRFRTDPVNPVHPHYCHSRTTGTVLGKRARYQLLDEVKFGGQAPRKAFMNKLVEVVTRRDLTEKEKADMSIALTGPSGYEGTRPSLSRARNLLRKQQVDIETVSTSDCKEWDREDVEVCVKEEREEIDDQEVLVDRDEEKSRVQASEPRLPNKSLTIKGLSKLVENLGDAVTYLRDNDPNAMRFARVERQLREVQATYQILCDEEKRRSVSTECPLTFGPP